MNSVAEDSDLAHLAIDELIRRSQLFFEGGGKGNDLKGRPGLIDVTHGAVFQGSRGNVVEGIRIEGRTAGERQNLARLWILHNHRSRFRVRGRDGALEFAFGDVLDLLVDGQDEVVAGFRLLL